MFKAISDLSFLNLSQYFLSKFGTWHPQQTVADFLSITESSVEKALPWILCFSVCFDAVSTCISKYSEEFLSILPFCAYQHFTEIKRKYIFVCDLSKRWWLSYCYCLEHSLTTAELHDKNMYFLYCSSAEFCHFCKIYLTGHKIVFGTLDKVQGHKIMIFRRKSWILLRLFSYSGWLLKHLLMISIWHLIFLSYLEKKQKHSAKKLFRLMVFSLCTLGYYYTCLWLSTLQTIVRKIHLFSKSHRRTDVELSFKQCTLNHLHVDMKWTGAQWELIGCFLSWA